MLKGAVTTMQAKVNKRKGKVPMETKLDVINELISKMGGNAEDEHSNRDNLVENVEFRRTLFESQFPNDGAASSAPGGV